MSEDSESGITALFSILLFGLIVWLLYWAGSELSETLIKAYHTPDTTIVIHNGVPDTTITIRK